MGCDGTGPQNDTEARSKELQQLSMEEAGDHGLD
jgi:hypothetical protein